MRPGSLFWVLEGRGLASLQVWGGDFTWPLMIGGFICSKFCRTKNLGCGFFSRAEQNPRNRCLCHLSPWGKWLNPGDLQTSAAWLPQSTIVYISKNNNVDKTPIWKWCITPDLQPIKMVIWCDDWGMVYDCVSTLGHLFFEFSAVVSTSRDLPGFHPARIVIENLEKNCGKHHLVPSCSYDP